MGLADKIITGDARAAARLISRLEDDAPGTGNEMDALYPHTGRACIIGITGAPGTGKSTLTDALTGAFRDLDKTVGVIAIDPSSPITGGAMLGDRVRMQRHSTDSGVFIRSLATRGWAGGLTRAAIGAVRVLDALGQDIILVETVGAGQVEVDIAAVADTTIVVLNPGAGDDIQTLKAGILEAADIFVINKADRDGADLLKADLQAMLAMKEHPATDWCPPVILTEAVNGRGMDELGKAIEHHRRYLQTSGGIEECRRERARLELLETAEGAWKASLAQLAGSDFFNSLVEGIKAGRTNPRRAARDLMNKLAGELGKRDKGNL